MLGRALFALVCLIIAAGLALPMYPPDVARPGPPAAGSALLAADTTTSGCENDVDGAGCRSTQAASAAPCVSLTVYLIVRPLPEKPPAI